MMKITSYISGTFKNISVLAGTLLILINLSVSCASVNSHMNYTHRSDTTPPTDAFAFIMVEKTAVADACIEANNFEECNQLLKFLPPIEIHGTGSGLLMWAGKKPVIITAAHVCESSSFPEFYSQGDMKIRIKTETKVAYRSRTGEVVETNVLAIDKTTDLCALEVKDLFAGPVRIARHPPDKGDVVYVVSAPYGINTPTMALIFSGFYSGYDSTSHFYTLPTRPGSSGSVILNHRYRGIGVTSAAFDALESVGIGPGHAELSEFLRKISEE
jgi:S1-C subfamily serine protease